MSSSISTHRTADGDGSVLGAAATAAATSGSGRTRPAARGTAFYRRKRAVKACQVCRARRTKCDNLKPSCSFCLKVGAVCIQSPVDLSSLDPASLEILARLESLEVLVKGAVSPERSLSKIAAGARSDPSSSLPAPPSRPALALGQVTPPGPEHLMQWAVFRTLRHGSTVAPDRCLWIEHDINTAATPALQQAAPAPNELEQAGHLLDSFFSYVHVKNPVLDEAATRNLVYSETMNGINGSPASCLCLLIFALGALASPFGPDSDSDSGPWTTNYARAHSFFAAAQRRIGPLLLSDDLIVPQCLFLSGIYMMCVFQPVKAWRFFMQALVHCQQSSLSQLSPRDDRDASGRPPVGCEGSGLPPQYSVGTLRQAIYWSSWKSERELRDILAPPDFSLADTGLNSYPPLFPTPPAFDEECAVAIMPHLYRGRSSWYFYLAEISLRRLTARVSDEMVAIFNQHPTRHEALEALAAAIPEYEDQARQWIASLPSCLSFDASPERDDVCRFVLRGHVINLFELIYWPCISARLNPLGSETASAGDACSSNVARLAQKALDYHLLRLVVNRPGYRHRHHGTILMMNTCCRSALVLAAAALVSHSEAAVLCEGESKALHLPQGWRDEVGEIINMLTFWGNETPQFSQVRHLLAQVCDTVS
ncbi:hypothetical protein CDD83_9731 [Cordyceps sp. RAO-2017]|nr:hypothetical protein CDD83_9731 [Cordyceps sp. RAO-2017]